MMTTEHPGTRSAQQAYRRLCGPTELTDLIGNTPLVRLRRVVPDNPRVTIYGKAEWANPGGSVKDRPALNMILEGERSGKLTPGKIILDATSGNTGIAYAMIGAARGYPVHLCLPANANEERKQLLRAYGAQLILTDPRLSSDGAILKAQEIYASNPDRYFYPDQYNNDANWQAHYRTTGPEIWEQTGGQITHFVAGLGTSGTFMGTGRYLKERNPSIRLISFQPDSPLHGLEGMKHMATAIVPGIYDPGLADENREVSTEEAYDMVKRLARTEGILVGISAAAAVVCALRVASEIREGVIVCILCDSGTRYLSERFWQDEYDGDPSI
ncbi:MAG: PLP-dependent cysteine synthase family protein [Chloroherpetonaceae bacterium]|nr:PLP-dependent cysteine synthase family protein [Chthonomonadaceae bacterium]MDW8209362.1 PLP-dependent cysteine synthase family protein [Chloroherpetonaceae bacterium]